MAQKSDLASKNPTSASINDDAEIEWIDTNAATRSTEKYHRMKWTFEKFSRIPLDKKIIGPDLDLSSACRLNTALDKTQHQIRVYFNMESDIEIKIRRNLILYDCNGKKWHEDAFGEVMTFCKNTEKDVIGSVTHIMSSLNSLTNDLLIIYCIIEIEGTVITEINNFQPVDSRGKLFTDLKTLYDNRHDADISLKVGDEVVLAHRLILCTRSPYFKKMFENKMEEREQNSVDITDVSLPTLQKLVEFLYTGVLEQVDKDVDLQTVYDLYYAADKCEVLDLRETCGNILLTRATVNNICNILMWADKHNDEATKHRSMYFVRLHFETVIKTDAWKSLVSTAPNLAAEVITFHTRKPQCP